MTKGVASADKALKNTDFNGELAGAILTYIEETDLSQSKTAYAKVKDWMTNDTFWCRRMRTDNYGLPNTLHFVQCGNSPNVCPIPPGDTRITMIYVPPLPMDTEIPKEILKERLKQEAPHFLRTLLDATLPSPEGRLRLPVVDTINKRRAQNQQRDPLSRFLQEECHHVSGERVLLTEFYDRFSEWLIAEQSEQWSKQRILRCLPPDYPVGIGGGNKKFIGNLSWEPKAPVSPAWICVEGRLQQSCTTDL